MSKVKGFTLIEIVLVLCSFCFLVCLMVSLKPDTDEQFNAAILKANVENFFTKAHVEANSRHAVLGACFADEYFVCSKSNRRYLILFLWPFIPEQKPTVIYQSELSSLAKQLHWRLFPRGSEVFKFHQSPRFLTGNGTIWLCSNHGQVLWAFVWNKEGNVHEESGKHLKCI